MSFEPQHIRVELSMLEPDRRLALLRFFMEGYCLKCGNVKVPKGRHSCRECVKALQRKDRVKNRERHKRWRLRHPEKWAELNRKSVKAHYWRNAERRRAVVRAAKMKSYREAKGIPLDWPKGKHWKAPNL